MTGERSPGDIRLPPTELDALVDWFEQIAYQLVLLAEFSLPDLRHAVEVFAQAVTRHGEQPPYGEIGRTGDDELARVLRADHGWFVTSAEQLRWFLRVVEGEDHGGHRQALGQYGRIFAEAVRRHRAQEIRWLAGDSRRRVDSSAEPPRSA